MSKNVDEKIVSMQFDNKSFESNVKTSMGTLEKLKQSLKLTEASKGLENVSSAAKKFDISPMGNGVEAVKMKFSALEVMAVTALANITNSAMNTGKKIVSAFTIDPIKTGFQEYETQINAVQTILANTESKGTTLSQVNAALDELNTYADKTIYNFTEMTRNIGTFTAAGVDLDTSVNAIQGIANLAATSGSTSQQASTAMYQLSQALSSGTVKLQDWNSVVNAGMGGQVFQDALKETARVHGVAIDSMIAEEGSFRETLQKGWLTSDILTETLQHFTEFTDEYNEETLKAQGYTDAQIAKIKQLGITGTDAATKVKTFTQLWDTLKEAAQSGWTQSWELIVGDFEEAKSLLTSISDKFGEVINKSAESRNAMLQEWNDLGGRQDLIDSFWNVYDALCNIITPIKKAFREIFPPKTGAQLKEMTGGFAELTAKIAMFTDKHGEQLYSIFKGIFSVIDIGVSFVKALAGGLVALVSNFTGLSGGALDAAASIGDFLSGIRDSIKSTNVFGTAINKVVGFIQKLIDKVKETGVIQKAIDKFKEFVSALKGKISMPGFDFVFETMKKLWDIFKKVGSVISTVGAAIGKAFSAIGSGLSEAFKSGDLKSGLDLLNSGILTGILLGVRKYISGITDALDDNTVGIFEKIKKSLEKVSGIFDSVKDSLKAWQQDLKANTLLKIAAAIGILAASILIIATINPEKLAASLGAITVLFADLMGSMAIFEKLDISGKGMMKSASAMLVMSIAVLVLTSAMKKLSEIETDKLYTGIVGVTTLLAELVIVSIIMSKSESKMVKGSIGIILLAEAIKILASVCQTFSTMSWEEIAKGLTGVTVLLAELTAVSVILSENSAKMVKGSVGLVLLGAALKILASVCKDFASMSWEEIAKGLTGVTVLLAELTAVSIILSENSAKMVKGSVGLVLLGAAMKILASVCKDFASMSWEEIAKGLSGLAVSLAAITIAMNFMPKNMVATGAGLIAVSAAIVILSSALGQMGSMSVGEMAKSLITLAISLGTLAVMLELMNSTLAGSAALLVAASALVVLSTALKILGGMSIGEIFKSLITLAGALTIIGIAAVVLTPAIPALLGLGAAITLIGVGCLAVGAGLLTFSAGLAALSAAGVAGTTALVLILNELILLIPTLLTSVGSGIVAMIKVFGDMASQIAESVAQVVSAILVSLTTLIPQLVELITTAISSILDAIVQLTPQIVQAGFSILMSLLSGIRDNIGEITTTVGDIIINFMDALGEKLPDIIQAGIDLVFNLIEGIGQGIEDNADRLREVMISFAKHLWNGFCEFFGIHSPSRKMAEGGSFLIEGLKNGLNNSSGSAISKMKEIGNKLANSVKEKAKSFKEHGKSLGTKLKDGISSTKSAVKSATQSVGENGLSGLKDKLSSFKDVGKNLIQGLNEGIKSVAKDVVDSVKGVASSAIEGAKNLLGIHSPSRVFMEIGKFVVEGFANGLSDQNGTVKNNSEALAKTVVKSADSLKTIEANANAASKALNNYSGSLYYASDAYKKEQESIEDHQTNIATYERQRKRNIEDLSAEVNSTKKLREQIVSLDEAIEASEKNKTAAGKKRTAELKAERAATQKKLDDMNVIKEAEKEITQLETKNANIDKKINNLNSSNDADYKARKKAIEDECEARKNALNISTQQVSVDKEELDVNAKIEEARSSMSDLLEQEEQLKKRRNTMYKGGQFGTTAWEQINKQISEIETKKVKIAEDLAAIGTKEVNTDFLAIDLGNKEIENKQIAKDLGLEIKDTSEDTLKTKQETVDTSKQEVDQEAQLKKIEDDRTAKLEALDESKQKSWDKQKEQYNNEKTANNERIAFLKQYTDKNKELVEAIEKENNSIKTNVAYLEQNKKTLSKLKTQRDGYKKTITTESKTLSKLAAERITLKNKLKNANAAETKSINSQISAIDKQIAASTKSKNAAVKNLTTVRDKITETTRNIEDQEIELASQMETFYKELATKVSDNVKSYLDPLSQSFDNGISNVFSKFEDATANFIGEDFKNNSSDMLDAMQSQVDGVSKWKENLEKLSGKLDEGLLAKLKELGPSATKEIEAFTHMTSAQLKKANEIFEKEQDMSTESLLDNYRDSADKAKEWSKKISQVAKAGFDQDLLQEIGEKGVDEGLEYMDVLLNMDKKQIAEFNRLRKQTLSISKNSATEVISSYEYAGSDSANAYRNSLEKSLKNSEANAALKTQCERFGKILAQNVVKGTKTPISSSMVKSLSSAIQKYVNTTGNKSNKTFEKVGKYTVEGFAKGINKNTSTGEKAATSLAKKAYDAAMKALDAHSPSKLFMKVGSYIPQGFAIGIDKFGNKVKDSTSSMAETAIDVATDSVRSVSDIVNDGLDVEPTITPVIDMDSAQTGTFQLGAEISSLIMRPIESMQSMFNQAQDEIIASNNMVIDAINGLRTDMNALYATDDAEISLYIDSKKMASTLVNPMNRQLSMIARRQGGL